jgi:hypothetical protein
MSMIGNFLRVTRTELDEYLKDSTLLEKRIYEDESAGEDPKRVDIDKSWDGIIFLLTGQSFGNSDHPLKKVFLSGQTINDDQDLGYGPGQYLTPEQVKELNIQLAKISIDDLRSRYDAKKMMELEVYPTSWENNKMVDYLTDYFNVVKEIYSEATKNDEAIITFLN